MEIKFLPKAERRIKTLVNLVNGKNKLLTTTE